MAEGLALTATGFPADFVWGSGTTAYQTEGAHDADGKGESIWDRFAHTPGTTADGATGDIACDGYHRWAEDLDLLAQTKAYAYRFSISWPRIFPQGRGQINTRGLDYYDRLVDGLLERGIAPYPTLYHWDLPQALQDAGGWPARDTAYAFADYALAVARRLSDRVQRWITLNEPHIIAYQGYLYGTKAPGQRDAALLAPVSHHLLLAHGLGTQALRAFARNGSQVGIADSLTPIEPASDRAEDEEAATLLDGLWHRWYLDPLFKGSYPDDVAPALAMPPDLVRPGDMETIAAPLDFFGLNYYTAVRVRAGQGVGPEPVILTPQGRLTAMGWEVHPEGLRDMLLRLQRDYQPRNLYVAENGAAYADTLLPDDAIHDRERSTFLREHMLAAREALAVGVPLRGYFVWSLLDNFEWEHGYGPRFGLIYTDFATQRRILKDSAYFFAETASTNGANL